MTAPSVCVIGAGSSGIASCQVLQARGIPFDCFETGSGVGGNWRFMNDNGMSSAYRSLHINTSRNLMTYASFPMPDDYPDYPDHFLIAKYFDDYVDHFGFRDRIRESSRSAKRTFLAMRRGAHVVPKYLFGKPSDETYWPPISRLPLRLQRAVFGSLLRVVQGRMTDYGLPDPDHKLFEAHPTISSDLLARIGHGDISVKPNVERYSGGRGVRFVDGSEEEIDVVVYCTGYRISFPFLAPEIADAKENHVPLYRRVVQPDRPGLCFIGLVQPLGAIMPIAEAQSEWIADVRHTIQVDFYPYMRTIQRERRRGRRARGLRAATAARSHELQVGRAA